MFYLQVTQVETESALKTMDWSFNAFFSLAALTPSENVCYCVCVYVFYSTKRLESLVQFNFKAR